MRKRRFFGYGNEVNLLHTKFYLPKVREHLVHRSSPYAPSGRWTAWQIVLISAPAGYGKTSLLADWYSGVPASHCLADTDENDNDPARFLEYFIHSFI